MKIINIIFWVMFVLMLTNEIINSESYLAHSSYTYGGVLNRRPIGTENICHWSSNPNFLLNENGAGDGITFNETLTEVNRALSTWTNVSTANISPTASSTSTTQTWGWDDFSTIYWAEIGSSAYDPGGPLYGAGSPGYNPGAVTMVVCNSEGVIEETDIIFNGHDSLKTWIVNTDPSVYYSTEITGILTHELGHCLGLGDLNNSLPQTMSTYCSEDPRDLTNDDRYGLSFIYGGSLIDDDNFSGTLYFQWPITVLSGETLTINSGATLNFLNSASLDVIGTLNATSTTFTSSGTWGGITFNSGSSGNLNGCTINNVSTSGGAAVTINNSSPTIQSGTINNLSGTTIGISIIGTGSPYILSNTITSSSNHGIYVYNGTGYIRDNTITGYTGSGKSAIYCDTYADGIFLPPGGGSVEGGNTIQGGVYGIYAYYHSSFSVGTGYTAHNNILRNNSTYNAAATYYSDIMAENNYWDVDPPSKTYKDLTSTIDYSPYYSLEKTSVDFSDNSFIIYKNIIEQNPSSDEAKKAVGKLWKLYKTAKDNAIVDYITKLVNDKSANNFCRATAMEVLSNIFAKENSFAELSEVNQSLIKEYPGTVHERNGRLNMFYAYYNAGDYQRGSESLTQARKNYSEDDAVLLANWLLEKDNNIEENSDFKSLSKAVVSIPSEFGLSNNYPNPFNPTTNLVYTIPENSFVNLTVYDVLGREIVNLVNETKQAGSYSVQFNATNLPSGVYFYKITAGNYSEVRKMNLLK